MHRKSVVVVVVQPNFQTLSNVKLKLIPLVLDLVELIHIDSAIISQLRSTN